jgi:hypothetical protein
MKNHEMVTRIREDQRLEELEKVIAKGQKTFVEVGLALAEIRDLRLYKREYGGFREYCQKKWGWERTYAHYIIEAAAVVKALPPKVFTIVNTESQARELAKIPAEERAGVVQAIVDSGKPVTAAEIRRHLPPPPMRPSDGEEADGTEGRDARGSRAPRPAPAPPPPSEVLDATGWPVPTQLIPLWQRAGEVQEWLSTLSRLKGVLRSAQANQDMLFAEMHFSSALGQVEQLWTDMKTARPFAVCPTCQGQVPDNCTLCRGRGLISEFRWNTCVPREDKEFREKAKKSTTDKHR